MALRTVVRRPLAWVALLLALSGQGLLAGDLVCRKPGIGGMEDLAARAKPILGIHTSDTRGLRVFIGVKDGDLYLHSNFVTPRYENPTKIATSNASLDLDVLVRNIITDQAETYVPTSRIIHAAEVIVDDSFMASATFSRLDLSNVGRLRVLEAETGRARAARQIVNGATRWVVEYDKHLYVRAGDAAAEAAIAGLKQHPFDRTSLRIVSLVTNSSTNSRLSELFGERYVRHAFGAGEIEQLIAANAGRTVVILGHVEGVDFVTVNAAGQEILRTSLATLDALAKRHATTLIPLGCNSARASAGVGVARSFNTIDAAERVHTASLSSSTLFDFLERLAAPKQTGGEPLYLVVDRSLADHPRASKAPITDSADVKVEVFRPSDTAVANVHRHRVAQIRILGLSLAAATSTGGTGGNTNGDGSSTEASGFPWTATLLGGGIVLAVLWRFASNS